MDKWLKRNAEGKSSEEKNSSDGSSHKRHKIQLNSEKDIETAFCTCPRGQFVCHHISALWIHGHHNISITEVECKWSSRKVKGEKQTVTVQDLYKGKPHQTTDRLLKQEEIKAFKESLKGDTSSSTCGFTCFARKGDVLPTRYNDKRDVYLLSTKLTAGFVEKSRYQASSSSNNAIQKPSTIDHYNTNMGAVDAVDQDTEPYICTRKSYSWFNKK
ncbi:hypothetical protein FQR65_LT15946 [Abscondita terminalis]|nr:hypothetical protein FQR65_LT15946 [Abscondita terminalis]